MLPLKKESTTPCTHITTSSFHSRRSRMQLLNKQAAKNIFAHTWYIYPLLIGLITVIWIWGFQAFHLPGAYESLTLFFATSIKDESFATKLMKTYYAKEKLRQVDAYSCLPTNAGYYAKLQLYLSKSDFLVLDERTIDEFKNYQDRLFVELDDELLEKYSLENYDFYTFVDEESISHKYGIKIKDKAETTYLDQFMTFDTDYDYYVCLSTSSVNLGYKSEKGNDKHDNAITYMKHLLEANQ